ncbi:MAG TPA: hypothetical protein VHA74_02790, partial [Candidatus Dojkabacteria bacterium]|nr:hypothetical protein [Candidatus Dojkabacteria bacterium]
KSLGYLVDQSAAKKAETDDEKAFVAIERAQEDFAEAIRVRALYPDKYKTAISKDENIQKGLFLDRIWASK